MNNSRHVTDVLKFISAIMIDIITLLLVFSIWALINLPLFPIALCAIFIAMLLLDVVIIIPKGTIRRWGIASYVTVLSATIIYYVFIMIFTGIVYSTITTRWYLILTLSITLIYIVTITGLYISGYSSRADVVRQETEKKKKTDINIQLMNIENSINHCGKLMDHDRYMKMAGDFNLMKERLSVSTPFGRVSKPVVVDLEDKISVKLTALNESISLLEKVSEQQKILDDILELLSEIKAMIKSREKLMIQ